MGVETMIRGLRPAQRVLGKGSDMLRLWREGLDTYDIAQILELREYQVYNRLKQVKEQERWQKQPLSVDPIKTEMKSQPPETAT